MREFFTQKSILGNPQTALLLAGFLGIRILSFLFFQHPILQGMVVLAVILCVVFLYVVNPHWAWCVLLTELFLGGAGHFFELGGISMRALLLAIFLILWSIDGLRKKTLRTEIDARHPLFYSGIILFLFILWGGLRGVWLEHPIPAVFRDVIPFVFFALVFPACHFFKQKKERSYLLRLVRAFIIGSALWSLVLFIVFSSNFMEVHGTFYTWLRDVAAAKITDMHTVFFRIVFPEHLLIVPFTLIITSLLMNKETQNPLLRLFQFLSLSILVFNLSRTYFLALFLGLLVLTYRHTWKVWMREAGIAILTIGVLFTGIHLAASGFQSPGWELFGIRIMSVVAPTIEESSANRMALLGPLSAMIQTHPLLGSGLGASLTFVPPQQSEPITTANFDWGYLELWAELGLGGLITYLFFLVALLFFLIQKIRGASSYHNFFLGLFAGTVSMLVMAITSPVLSHVFGILFLAGTAMVATKPDTSGL